MGNVGKEHSLEIKALHDENARRDVDAREVLTADETGETIVAGLAFI